MAHDDWRIRVQLAERAHAHGWEVLPQNPFAVFGGLGGAGTPL